MRKTLYILICVLYFGLNSCCDTFCKRHKHAEFLIDKIEKFRTENGRLPKNLSEINVIVNDKTSVYYLKISNSTYEVWYGIGFESNIYNSKTKEWREEG